VGDVKMKKLIFIFFIVLVSTTGYAESIQDKLVRFGITVPKKKTEAIDFELEDMNGDIKKLSSYSGKVVFLNFWATWCGPCRIEMPSMQRVYEEFKDKGFVIVAVDLQEDKKVVKKFITEYNLTFPVLLDKTGKVGGIYGARSIPTTYLIDRNGYIIGRQIGAREWDTQEFKELFGEILQNGVEYD
jgi:thiol-disulfide isomerase/thioredoxin